MEIFRQTITHPCCCKFMQFLLDWVYLQLAGCKYNAGGWIITILVLECWATFNQTCSALLVVKIQVRLRAELNTVYLVNYVQQLVTYIILDSRTIWWGIKFSCLAVGVELPNWNPPILFSSAMHNNIMHVVSLLALLWMEGGERRCNFLFLCDESRICCMYF